MIGQFVEGFPRVMKKKIERIEAISQNMNLTVLDKINLRWRESMNG